jgi:hypothetical protein
MWWYLPVWFFVALATLYVEFRVIRWFVGVVLDTRNKVRQMGLVIKCGNCKRDCTKDYVQAVRRPKGDTLAFYCLDCWVKMVNALRH